MFSAGSSRLRATGLQYFHEVPVDCSYRFLGTCRSEHTAALQLAAFTLSDPTICPL